MKIPLDALINFGLSDLTVFYFESVLNQKYHKFKFKNKITFWDFDN